MRTWRVGTFSMGATLIMLGIFLLVSQWFGFDMIHVMVSWWPIILIVLGGEILLFLIKSKEDKPFLKYDFLSIIFVGLLGTVGIGFAVLQSTGLIDRAEELMSRENKVFDLPELNYSLDQSVSRIVVDTGNYPITVEGITSSEISMFGTYEVFSGKKEQLVAKPEDYVSVLKKGETVYVKIKGASVHYDSFGDRTSLAATLLVPQHVKLEVNGNYNEITVKPRMLMSNWLIDKASNVSVQLQEKSDLLLSATDVQQIKGNQEKWKFQDNQGRKKQIEKDGEETWSEDDGSDSRIKSATYQLGKGTNELQLKNIDHVSLTTVK